MVQSLSLQKVMGYTPVTQHFAAYVQILFFLPIDKTAKLYYDIGA